MTRTRTRTPDSGGSYAEHLLRDCDASTALRIDPAALHERAAADADVTADVEWARSGAMWLTGEPAGPPRLAPGPLAVAARGAAAALRALAPDSTALRDLDGPALLGERAAIAGLHRRGRTAPGGGCRLLRCADGWIALGLARPEDEALMPAWLQTECAPRESAWEAVTRRLPECDRAHWVERGRLMGLPIAPADPPRAQPPAWLRADHPTPRTSDEARAPGGTGAPRVLDLSGLWAGPLCAHLLGLAGADVVKVESTRRPDGARGGPRAFFDLINGGKHMLALDLADPRGVETLRALIRRADIVIEAARPRALAQLGIHAEALVAACPQLTWVSITGYGRGAPERDWVAFGDDAGVAAGLAAHTGSASERPLFCGDAIADPLTGLHAAVAALASHRAGGGALLELSLRDVTEHALGWRASAGGDMRRADARVERAGPAAEDAWCLCVGDRVWPVARPRARSVTQRAGGLGADTAAVLAGLDGERRA